MEEDYANARYYSSAIQGRFTSPDPYAGSMHLDNPQTMNRYSYAMNNPVRFADPTGLDPCFNYDYDASYGGSGPVCMGNSWGEDGGDANQGGGGDPGSFTPYVPGQELDASYAQYDAEMNQQFFENYYLSVIAADNIQQIFANAESEALKRLQNPSCQQAFPGGAERIVATHYVRKPQSTYNIPGWQMVTTDTTHVTVNSQGYLYNFVPGVSLPLANNQSYSPTSATQLGAFEILHELTHQFGFGVDDTSDRLAQEANNIYVNDNCFQD